MINIASYGTLFVLSLSLFFHICVLLRVVPYSIVWGGRLKTVQEMVRFEVVSIFVNSVLVVIVLIQIQVWAIDVPPEIMRAVFWGMAALFLLNTVGNLVSKSKLEKVIFTPVTLLLAVFSAVLALWGTGQ